MTRCDQGSFWLATDWAVRMPCPLPQRKDFQQLGKTAGVPTPTTPQSPWIPGLSLLAVTHLPSWDLKEFGGLERKEEVSAEPGSVACRGCQVPRDTPVKCP